MMSASEVETAEERVQMLVSQLEKTADVLATTVVQTEPTPRLRIELAHSSLGRASEVQTILQLFGLQPERINADGQQGMCMTVAVPDEAEMFGTYPVRTQGASGVISIPTEAIDSAGLELGDGVQILSQEGEIRLVKET